MATILKKRNLIDPAVKFIIPDYLSDLDFTKRQIFFFFEYLKNFCVKSAAIKSGYLKKDAESIGLEILKHSNAKTALNRIAEREVDSTKIKNCVNEHDDIKTGRPTTYKTMFNEQAFVACADLGAFDKELAKLFGVCEGTILNWKREQPAFFESIKNGVIEYGNKVAILNLRKRVEGFHYKEVKVEDIELKGRDENSRLVHVPASKTTTTTKYLPPDVGALCFWLKNKLRDDWKDYKAVELGNLDNKSWDIRVTVDEDE